MPEQEDAGVSLEEALAFAADIMKKGHLEAAAETYRRILAVAPDQVDALHYLGVTLYHLGKTNDAVDLLCRALTLDPGYADAHNNLGNILRQHGMLAEAKMAYSRALELRPDDAQTLSNLGTIYRAKGELAEAARLYRRAIELAPDHFEAHHNLGNALWAMHHDDEALDAFRRALFLRPHDASSYRRLATAYYAVGRVQEAADLYRKWLEFAPNDPEALHMLSACTGERVPERASDEYVRQMFDRFAGSFDEVLARLEYRAPAIVADVVESAFGAPRGDLDVLDAGCGTGLAASLFRPFAKRLVGIDLSEKMLSGARERGQYDELERSELTGYLERHPASYDLVVSVDTLVYFGRLSQAAAGLVNALRPGGRAVFTVEKADRPAAPEGYRLNPHGRYAHTEDYLRRVLGDAGLEVEILREVDLRMERKEPVAGFVVIAKKVNRTST